MRAKLILDSDEVILPYNYNYHLSSAIYSAFEEADPDLADYLHRSKEIKLYTFSRILVSERETRDKGLLIKGPRRRLNFHRLWDTKKILLMN